MALWSMDEAGESAPGRRASLDALMARLGKQRVAELSVLAINVLWGISFVVVKAGLRFSSPMVFTALRFSVAGALLLYVYRNNIERVHVPGAALVGLLLFGGFSFQTAGLARTSASRSAFFTALCIPLTPFCQCIIFRRLPTVLESAGAAVALLGTFLLTLSPGAEPGSGSKASLNVGDALTLGCAVLFAFHMNALNHYSATARGASAFQTVAVGQVTVCAALSLLLCGVVETAELRPDPLLIACVLLTGVLATALAFTVFTWAQKHTSATRAAIICASESLFAAITAFLVNGDRMTGLNCLGGLLIVASICVGELRVTLPPPPRWLPAALLPQWERTRAAQAEQAAAKAAEEAAGNVEAPGEGAGGAKGVELAERVEERVGLLEHHAAEQQAGEGMREVRL